MARPSATSSSTEPSDRPVKITPSRSPQASRPRTASSDCCSAARTSGSASPPSPRRSCSRLATVLWLLAPSSLAAARRLARSDDEIRIAARIRSRLSFSCGSVSAASALSISGSWPSSSVALPRSTIAARRTARSGENRRRVDSTASSAPRIRLLLVTSSASSGSVAGSPVAAIGRLVVLDQVDLVAGDLDLAVEQRLHERGETGVAARRRRVAARRSARRCRPPRSPVSGPVSARRRHRRGARVRSRGTAAASAPSRSSYFFVRTGSSFLPLFSGMNGLHGWALTGPGVFHTTLN